jgi:hypothetical protein
MIKEGMVRRRHAQLALSQVVLWQASPPYRRGSGRLQCISYPLGVYVPSYVRELISLGERGDRRQILVDSHDLSSKDRDIVARSAHDASTLSSTENPDRFRSVTRLSDRHCG